MVVLMMDDDKTTSPTSRTTDDNMSRSGSLDVRLTTKTLGNVKLFVANMCKGVHFPSCLFVLCYKFPLDFVDHSKVITSRCLL